MIAPRSMTRATRSRPCEILMLSTAVSMLGNVLSTRSVRTPGSNGVYRFGSQVSVCAIPPAIHNTMTASAVAARTSSLRVKRSRLATDQRRERGACRCAHECSAADQSGENRPLFSGQVEAFVRHDSALRKSAGIPASSAQPITGRPNPPRTCGQRESGRSTPPVLSSALRPMARVRTRTSTTGRRLVSRPSVAGREAAAFRVQAEPVDPYPAPSQKSGTARESSRLGQGPMCSRARRPLEAG